MCRGVIICTVLGGCVFIFQVAKEMPKVEPKSVNFSSRNKFAALLETDE